ncbi:MAG: Uma2 family endonuclease [Acidobacteriota bacterium]
MAADPKDSPRHYYTLEEYFALERTGDGRYEYWDGEIVSMSGGSKEHGMLTGNIYFGLRRQMAGRGCKVFNSEIPVRTPSLPPYRYPDTSVVCGEAEFENVDGIDTLINPTLVVEVLSLGTERRDRNEKRAAYQALPSLTDYLMLAQDAPHATHFARQGERWVRSDYGDLNASIVLKSIECVLTLSEIYAAVEFE